MQGDKGCVQQVPWGSCVLNVMFCGVEVVVPVILSYLGGGLLELTVC